MMRKSLEPLIITLPPAPQEGWRTRFAPSPTGYLHLGHIASALWVWLCGRKIGAQIDLRIEDHDRGRCRPKFEDSILEDLDWLGLVPDRGILANRRADPDFRQSSHRQRYEHYLGELQQRDLVFACHCSRKEVAAHADPGDAELHYPGTCRNRAFELGPQTGIRLKIEAEELRFRDGIMNREWTQNPAHQCGDMLLQERSGFLTYQFCVAIDDMVDGINLIIRGADLIESTGRQILLARMLGRPRPAVFAHHPLVLGDDGNKLSKRIGSASIAELRAAGMTKEALFGKAAMLLGLQPDASPRALDEFMVIVQEGSP